MHTTVRKENILMNIRNRICSVFRNYISISILNNISIVLVLSLIAYSRYEQDIDIMMQTMLYNIVGKESSSYVLFMNVFVAKFMKCLIETFDGVAWYSVIQYILIFISLSSISCLYLRKEDGKVRRTILSVFLIFVGYECYIRPSYMKTSSILCIAGAFLLITALEVQGKRNIKKIVDIILSCSMVILSGMFSWRAFAYTFTISIALILIMQIIRKKKWVVSVYFILVAVALSLFSYGLYAIDASTYAKHEDKVYGYEYKNALEKVVMFGYPEYTNDIGETIDVSEDDYTLATSGFYLCDDEGAMSIIDKAASITMDITPKNILKFFRTIPINILQNGLFYMTVIMAVFMYWSKGKKNSLLVFTAIVFTVAYMIAFFNYSWDNSYMHFIIWVPVACLLMMQQEQIRHIDYKNMMIWLVVFSVVLYNKFSNMIVTSVEDSDMEATLYQDVTDDTTVCCVDINSFLKKYSIFEKYPEGLLADRDIVLLNGDYSIYSMFDDYIYTGDWNNETSITWLDCDRDYSRYLFESELNYE